MERFFLLLTLFGVSALLPAQDWSSWIDRYGASIAKVEIRSKGVLQASGTAFAIAENGRLLTSAHVVSAAQFDSNLEIQLTLPLASPAVKPFVAQIESISDELDLAVLKTDHSFPSFVPLSTADKPRLMNEVLVMGFPLGLNFKATPGYVQAYQEVPELGTMLDLSASVDPGNSGGPVLTKDGAAVGIVTSRIVGYNFNLALPVRNVTEFLALGSHPVRVAVETTPAGARIFANGVFKGISPLELELRNRQVEVTAEKEGFESMKRTVTVEGDQAAKQTFVLVASASTTTVIKVTSEPTGAKVWINNTDKGTTPLEFVVDKGTRLRIRAELPGYATLNRVVDLNDENEQTIPLSLTKKSWF